MHRRSLRFLIGASCCVGYAAALNMASAAQVEAPIDAEQPIAAPPEDAAAASDDPADTQGEGPSAVPVEEAEELSEEEPADEEPENQELVTEPGPKPEGPASAAPPEVAPPPEQATSTADLPARAEPPPALQDRYGPMQSPQDYALELRIGPYRSDVDSYAGAPDPGPYEQFFGNRRRLYFGAEFDWQLIRIPYTGTAGVGLGVGYTRAVGPNTIPTGTTPDAEVDQRSTFNVLPTYAVAVVRIDELARRFPVPLVPYAKFGLGVAFWWIDDGDGAARTQTGEVGRGRSIGTQAALGMMLQLDMFEPSAAKALDSNSGVNHSYLFLEWSQSSLGTSDQMQVGASTWVTGLALEM